MESLFACLGGWLILKENLGIRGYIGSVLMIGAMLLSQSPNLSLKMHKTLSAAEVDFTQSKTNKITAK